MRAGQAGPALGVKAGLAAPVTVRVYFTRPRAGTDRTNGPSWSNHKPLHRGSRTCRPFAPNQGPFKEDRGFIDWLDGLLNDSGCIDWQLMNIGDKDYEDTRQSHSP